MANELPPAGEQPIKSSWVSASPQKSTSKEEQGAQKADAVWTKDIRLGPPRTITIHTTPQPSRPIPVEAESTKSAGFVRTIIKNFKDRWHSGIAWHRKKAFEDFGDLFVRKQKGNLTREEQTLCFAMRTALREGDVDKANKKFKDLVEGWAGTPADTVKGLPKTPAKSDIMIKGFGILDEKKRAELIQEAKKYITPERLIHSDKELKQKSEGDKPGDIFRKLYEQPPHSDSDHMLLTIMNVALRKGTFEEAVKSFEDTMTRWKEAPTTVVEIKQELGLDSSKKYQQLIEHAKAYIQERKPPKAP